MGKSTLFNRLVGHRDAIVDNQSGVTRDRHYGVSEWNGHVFSVVDTGGFVKNSEDLFEAAIREQVTEALSEADLVLFVVDVQTGITDLDQAFADVLRRSSVKILVVVNKVDSFEKLGETAEFYALGFDEVWGISADSGLNTGDLMDEIVMRLREQPPKGQHGWPESVPRLAIVGRPNAGKSTLANALLGEARTIVSDIAGTTRDTVEAHYKKYGKEFVLVDTAGLRRKSKVGEDVEFYANLRAIQAIEAADVCMVVVDGVQPFSAQDTHVLFVAQKRGKGIVVLVNKWDQKETRAMDAPAYRREIQERLAPFRDVPILFISALHKEKIYQAVDTALQVYQNRNQRIPTRALNDQLLPIIEKNPPPATKGKYIRIKFVQQIPTQVPTFLFFCNLPQYIQESYQRFLENQIRSLYDFTGVPIHVFFRKK